MKSINSHFDFFFSFVSFLKKLKHWKLPKRKKNSKKEKEKSIHYIILPSPLVPHVVGSSVTYNQNVKYMYLLFLGFFPS